MKKCSKCGEEKALDQFSKDKKAAGGVSARCKCCVSEYKKANKEAFAIKSREWIEKNRVDYLAKRKRYREANKGYIAEKFKEYREENKARLLAANKAWREANSPARRATESARRAARTVRTVEWCDTQLVKLVYEYASQFDNVHIDHIVPLQGKAVSGLHVPENLRVIPAVKNLEKKNKFEPGQDLDTPTIYTKDFNNWLASRRLAA